MFLVTGGLGYIGTHLCIELLKQNNDVIIIDNKKSHETSLLKIVQLAGKEPLFFNCDVDDIVKIDSILSLYKINHIVHLVDCEYKPNGKLVGEDFIRYAYNHTWLESITYCSTSSVYGSTSNVYINELDSIKPLNEYGIRNVIFEQLLKNIQTQYNNVNINILRCFSVIGTHPSGVLSNDYIKNNKLIGDIYNSIVTGESVGVYCNHNTNDGTYVDDYVDIEDVVSSIIVSINKSIGINTYNIASGICTSVNEVIDYVNLLGYSIQTHKINTSPTAISYMCANINKAGKQLGWYPKIIMRRTIENIFSSIKKPT